MHEQQQPPAGQHPHHQQQQQQQSQQQQSLPLSLTSHLHHHQQQTQLHHLHHSHSHLAHHNARRSDNAAHGTNDHPSSITGYAEEGSFMFSLPFDDSSSQLDLPSLLQANVNSVTHHHHQQHLRGGSPTHSSASMGWEERTKKSADNGTKSKKRKSGDSEVSHDSPKPARTKKKRSTEKSAPPQEDSELLDGTNFEDSGDMFEGVGDNKELKRQMRLVKNRQAAQQFRKRQKQYIQDLEKRCNTLTAQNAAYCAKVELLTTENRLIKEQLDYLRSFVSQAVQVSLSPAAISAGPLQVSSALSGTLGPPGGALTSQPSPTGPQSSSRGFSLHSAGSGGSSGSVSSKMSSFTGSGGSPQHSLVGLGLGGTSASNQGPGLPSQQPSQRYSTSRIPPTIPPPHYQPPHPRGGISSQISDHHRPMI